MTIGTFDIAVIVTYLVAVLGVGLYQARKVRSSGDYYAGGRKFNKFYLMMHALGTASHADEPVSVIGGAYQKGVAGIWYTYLYLPLTPIFWLLAPYIRRTRFVTMADFFHARYDSSLATLYAVMGVLKFSVAIGVTLTSTATLFSSLGGVSLGDNAKTYAILAMTAVFVTYGFAGGLRATVVTETIQGPLIVIMSLLLLPFGVYAAGGFAGLHRSLDESMFSLTSGASEFSPVWIVAYSITALVGWVAQPGIVAAVGSGKSELEGRVGYTYGTMIKRLCAIGWVFTGVTLAALSAQGKVPAEAIQRLAGDRGREQAFGVALQLLLPTGLLGLVFAAIFASQMATCSAQMVNSSALASRNLYVALFRPNANDREVLWFGRVSGLFLVAIGVFLAFSFERVATALTALLGFSSIMGVVVWGGVLWRRATAKGAWAAVVVLFVLWASLGPIGMQFVRYDWFAQRLPSWVGMYGSEKVLPKLLLCYMPAGVFTLVVVSLLTRPQPKRQVDDFFLLLKTPVGQEDKLTAAGVKPVYVGTAVANPLEINHPRLVHWGGCAAAALVCLAILGLLLLLARIGRA